MAVSWPLAQTANVERITGFYMNIAKFLPALALFLIWIPTTWWVDDDSFALGLEKRALWTSSMVLAGTIGLLVILFVPNIIAGIAAGLGTSFSGVAKSANIIAIQVFSPAGSGSGAYDSDIIAGLNRVLALKDSFKIAAVNMSLGNGRIWRRLRGNYAVF
jgi:hypothetical protein